MRRVAIIAAALLAGLAVAAVGDVRKDGFKVGSGATEGGSVACTNGKSPTGGGFTLEQKLNGPLGPERLAIETSHPDGKKWVVRAYNFDGAKKRGSAIAICSKDDDLVVRSKSATVAEGMEGVQATPRCPDGSKAVGGGGRGPGGNSRFRGSFPGEDSKSWGARFDLLQPGEVVKGWVVCDTSPRGTKVVEDSATNAPGRRGSNPITLTAKAECPAGKQPTGGGHFSTANPDYLESRPVEGAWRIKANAADGVTVVAYAVCQ